MVKDTGLRVLLTFACLVIVIGGMKAAEAIIVPFILAVFISILVSPGVYWMKRRGLPTWLAVLIVILLVAGALVGVSLLIGQSLREFTNELPRYQEKLSTQWESIVAFAARHGIELPAGEIHKLVNPATALGLVQNLFAAMLGILANGFLILLIIVFLLLEASDIPDKIRAIAVKPQQQLKDMDFLAVQVFRYFAIKTATSLATGIFVAVWLWIFGVKFAFLWGLLAFLLNYIPNIGSLIAAIPAVLLALVEQGFGGAMLTATGYVIVNTVVGSIIEPRVMGEGLGLSTLVVFLSLIFWGWVLGPIGMLLSAPLTMGVKIVLQSQDDTRWVAVLLSSGKAVRTLSAEKLAAGTGGSDSPPPAATT